MVGEEAVLSGTESGLEKVGMHPSSQTPLFLTQSMFDTDLLSSRGLFRLFFPLQSGELDMVTKKREHTEAAHRGKHLFMIVGVTLISN